MLKLYTCIYAQSCCLCLQLYKVEHFPKSYENIAQFIF